MKAMDAQCSFPATRAVFRIHCAHSCAHHLRASKPSVGFPTFGPVHDAGTRRPFSAYSFTLKCCNLSPQSVAEWRAMGGNLEVTT
jgi:hypothetical protein